MLLFAWSAIAATPFVVSSVPAGGDVALVGALCGTEVGLPAASILADCVGKGPRVLLGVTVRTDLTHEERRRWSLHEAESFGVLGTLAPDAAGANPFGTEGVPESTGIGGLISGGLGGGTPIPNETVDRGMVQDDGGRVWWRFVGDALRVTANIPSEGWFAIGLGAPNLRSIVVRPNGYSPIAMECGALPPNPCGEGTPVEARLVDKATWQTLEIDIPTSPASRGVILVPGDRLRLYAKWGRGADPAADDEVGSIYEEIQL